MSRPHPHADPHCREHTAPGFTLLCASAGHRLCGVVVLMSVLWAAVWWALQT